MDKNKVKAPILIKIALAFFTLLFFLSATSLFYFKFYLGNDAVIPPYIRFFADTMRGSMGYFYYTAVPALIVISLVLWAVIAKAYRKEKMLNELEHTIPVEDNDIMRSVPFQDIVSKSDNDFKNHDLRHEVSTQTLKSPIVPTQKVPCVHQAKETQTEVGTDVCLEFAPKYVLQNEISSISELKEIIAKGKIPEISICTNDDLSSLSDDHREQMKRINSLDTNKIFAKIKQNNIELDLNDQEEKLAPKLTYRVVLKQAKQPKQKAEPKCETLPVKVELKYLTADEIVSRHRIDCESKKNANEFVFSACQSEKKTLGDMAKFYYESDLQEYSIEEN
ncbi:MAG: hypothetical protein WAX04_11060 [Oscillospiraceae bacterium]